MSVISHDKLQYRCRAEESFTAEMSENSRRKNLNNEQAR